jgi:signal transduction histidine kinase
LTQIVESIALVVDIVLLVDQLGETTRKQAHFLEDIAHDIRSPIQSILFEARVFARGLVEGERAKQRARKLAAQVWRLHIMSQRVWTSAEIERGAIDPDDVERVDIFEVLTECKKSLNDLALNREIEISIDSMFQSLQRRRFKIEVNRTLFFQAVLNLIDNAVKYSSSRSEVRIDGTFTANQVTISFVNRGIPIREEEKDRIFERYYRTKEARVFKSEGTGIGLYIVRTFIDHYGDIEVKSIPIEGTRDYVTEFKLILPRKESRRA